MINLDDTVTVEGRTGKVCTIMRYGRWVRVKVKFPDGKSVLLKLEDVEVGEAGY